MFDEGQLHVVLGDGPAGLEGLEEAELRFVGEVVGMNEGHPGGPAELHADPAAGAVQGADVPVALLEAAESQLDPLLVRDVLDSLLEDPLRLQPQPLGGRQGLAPGRALLPLH